MKQAVILAAGKGEKMWPYTSIRNKSNLPIANVPNIVRLVENLKKHHVDHIVVVVSDFAPLTKHQLRHFDDVIVICDESTQGSAESLLASQPFLVQPVEKLFIVFGDCVIESDDLARVIESDTFCALTSTLKETSSAYITVDAKEGLIQKFKGHHRGGDESVIVSALSLPASIFDYCLVNPKRFDVLKVGVSTPLESFLEVSINDMMSDGLKLQAITSQDPIIKLSKPWHFLLANTLVAKRLCSKIHENTLGENATIDLTARIDGFVQLGKNSVIGRGVWIKGNCIIGDDVVIEHYSVLEGNNIIGDRTTIFNMAKVANGSVIGKDCRLDQTFEFLGGTMMDHVYAVHLGEFFGCLGENSDLGAGTICGTLRFDDGQSVHRIKGKKEVPIAYANATYLGDQCRTGVGAYLMPGVKIGARSVVGSGVVLSEDLEDDAIIFVKQETVIKKWRSDQYGW